MYDVSGDEVPSYGDIERAVGGNSIFPARPSALLSILVSIRLKARISIPLVCVCVRQAFIVL